MGVVKKYRENVGGAIPVAGKAIANNSLAENTINKWHKAKRTVFLKPLLHKDFDEK